VLVIDHILCQIGLRTSRVEITMSRIGKRLIAAAREARAIARGEADPKTYRVYVAAKMNVKKTRKKRRPVRARKAAPN
jgi:putative transcriptional regulator